MSPGDSIQFAPLAAPWILAIFGAISLVLLGISLVRDGRGWCRLAFLGTLFLALMDPRVVREERGPQDDIVVVVLDETSSQRTGERLSQVAEAEVKLRERLDVETNLDVRLVRVTDDAGVRDRGTRLYSALETALADVPASRFAGAVLVTDGQVHDLPGDVEERRFGAPVHVLLTGAKNERDRHLVVTQAPAYGIVGKQVTISYQVEDRGAAAAGGQVSVQIRVDGKKVETALAPAGEVRESKVTLDHAGPALVELEVTPLAGELSTVNNTALVRINGVRDRLRVLLISGQPHPGERTWRNLLKSDPSVDLVHFTILRPPDKEDFTPTNELALIAFPTRQLFEERLDEFDLIVFDRYLVRDVIPRRHLVNIAEYVRKGGALLLAVGPEFAGLESLYLTGLRNVLPVAPTGDVLSQGFKPRASDLGRRHPVTEPLAKASGPEEAPSWGRWFRQVQGDVKGGETLITGAGGAPLLVLERVGEGRVAQLMSDHIWLWARGYEGGGPQGELLRRLAHWLMKEPDLEEERLKASVKGRTLTVERRTLARETPGVTVTAPSGEETTLKLPATAKGVASATLDIDEIGLYRLADGEHIALAAAGKLNPLELSDLRATDEVLAPLVTASGGASVWLSDGLPDIRRVKAGRDTAGRGWLGLVSHKAYVVTGLKEAPLLPGVALMLLALSLLMLAWWREGR